MSACKRSSFVIEKAPPPVPPEKGTRWFFGKVRRPFLETLKRTDKECQRTWLCCGQRDDPIESGTNGRYHKGDKTLDRAGELNLSDGAPDRRRRAGRPRWGGLIFLLVTCVFSIFGSTIMWSTDALHNFVAKQMILDDSKSSFGWWLSPPIHPWFSVYIWNYTNWDEYMANPGTKIKLQQVGPFTYSEVILREGTEFDPERVTLSYREVKTYKFSPEKSGADPNATVVVPNLPFFSAKAKASAVPMPSFFTNALNEAVNMGLKALKSGPLVTVKANDLIWGYEDNLLSVSKLNPLSEVPMDRVGLLNKKNTPDDMVILTGSSDVDKLSYFVRYNNETSLHAWPQAACNSFEGSDGSMFPPRKVRARAPLFAYKAEACRLIKFVFKEESEAQGVRAHRYIMDRGTFMSPRTNPDNQCFCKGSPDECAPDGLFDTSPCSYGAPTLISYPHFFLTDPRVLEPFEGLHPDESEHDMYADIHPRLGMTLQGKSRLQLNVRVVWDEPRLRKGLVLPVAWFAQDLPSYEGGFKTMLIVASYGLDGLEFVLLYVLPVVALITALLFVRRLARRRAAFPSRSASGADLEAVKEVAAVCS